MSFGTHFLLLFSFLQNVIQSSKILKSFLSVKQIQ